MFTVCCGYFCTLLRVMVWQWQLLLASYSGYVIDRGPDITALLMAVVILTLILMLTLTVILNN